MNRKLPIFTTSEGREKYIKAYDAMFSLWKVPHDAIDVMTSFGSTHINVSGPSDGPPLILLHSSGLSSTAWYLNIAELSVDHRVFAVDTIGDAGKSTAERIMEQRADYANWLREVFDGLNIEKAHLLGHSHGGWLSLNMALAHPDRVQKIVLLAPAASLLPLSLISQIGLRVPLKLRLPARTMFKIVASRGTVFEETFIQMMDMVTRYCLPVIMFPTVFTDAELKQISLPTLLLIGSEEKIYNPKKAIERAQRLLPNLTAEIIPHARHTLHMEQPQIINSHILEFLRQ